MRPIGPTSERNSRKNIRVSDVIKPIRVRPLADIEMDAHADYIARDNLGAALRFLDAAQAAFDQISDHPSIGSRRYAYSPLLEDLRVWAVPDFENYLVFYLERSDHVDVLRILHAARDIPAALRETSPS
ncbi:MAG: type II toxin-antitoxin system RelE/ParE family toxin [Methylococcaceae bacterium]|nr:MAG: type II toxin-antitoxin system RelE/ParE family toxin [Methylococcaceae bacterium]